jgi:hypothetical protein
MIVADIDKNMEWHILNLFLIAYFNLRSIIFCLIKNTTKPVYQSDPLLVPKNDQIVMVVWLD